LLEYGFTEECVLAVYGGEDTGLLQVKGNVYLEFDIELRGEIKYIDKINTNYGIISVYDGCNIPSEYIIDRLEIRMFEDPHYKDNFKREVVDMQVVSFE